MRLKTSLDFFLGLSVFELSEIIEEVVEVGKKERI
nr:MAG TPA: hypothetical protein [Caudoviricetes sp.]